MTILYHSTPYALEAVTPMLHLGTQQAALDRLSEKSSAGGLVYALETEFERTLTIPDDPNRHHAVEGIVQDIENLTKANMPGGDPDDLDPIMDFDVADELLMAARSETGGRFELAKFLEGLDIHALRYENAWEDAGSESFVLVDVRRAKMVDCRRWAPGEPHPFEEPAPSIAP